MTAAVLASRFSVKRQLAAIACVAASTSALAQSTVIYGLIDVAIEHVTNVGPSGTGLNRMPSATGSLPSRVGFRASEDLGDGLSAVVVLEQGFAPDMGSFTQGGRAFGRQSFVSFVGPWGLLAVGRQYTMLYWSILDADILGTNIYGSGSLDAYIPNARADNAVTYRGTFLGLTVGATFSLGRDGVNAGSPAGTNCAGESSDARECREWSALLKYDRPSWGAALAFDEIRGGPGAFANLTSSSLRDRRLSVNGYVDLASVRVAAGLVRRDNDGSAVAPGSDLWYLGALYAPTPTLRIEAEAFRLVFNGNVNRATLLAGRVTYSLSKRSALYATLGHIDNAGALALSVSAGAPGSNPQPGTGQIGMAMGVRHSF